MRRALPLLALILVGCGSSDPEPTNNPSVDAASSEEGTADTAVADAPGDTTTSACPRAPRPEGAPRKVVVSHPFGADSKKTGAMEVLDLASDGTLTRSGKTFALGAAAFEPIVFTPDGELGFVGEDDGSIGIFRFDGEGAVTVVNPAFKGDFYAGKLAVDPNGQRLYVVDSNTEENGGGIYAFDIKCDGTLESAGKVVAAKSWQVFAFFHGDTTRAIAAGGPALGSMATVDAHLLSWSSKPSLLASTAPFGDRDAIPSWIDLTPDDKYALIADNGILKGNRVAVISISATAIAPLQIFTLDNPAAVIASPYGNAALVLNSDGKDGFTILKFNAGSPTAPFTNGGKLAYVHGRPELPSVAATISRGPLKGRVLVAENLAVRQLQFTTDGAITDLAKLSYPSGIANIVGTIGVQP